MVENQKVFEEAQKLGSLIGSHAAVKRYMELTHQLELDVTAKALIGEFEQLMETLATKEASMQPIEVAEKQKFQSLQQSMAIHPLIQKLMAAQTDYTDLMRKVQEAINKGISTPADGPQDALPAKSKIILD